MNAYHRHSSYSNLFTSFKDSAMSFDDYAKRDVELGHSVFCMTEHGWQSNFLRAWEAANKYGLQFVYGVEAYWVKDRTQPDASNGHIIILARNIDGIHQINEMLSSANETGYYRVPRVDMELLKKLNPDDVLVTTACVAFWGKVNKETHSVNYHYSYDDMIQFFLDLKNHFGSSLYLEVQAHNTKWQKEVNKLVRDLHYQHGVPLIAGTDSHYVYDYQREERKWLREESGVRMDDEDHEFNSEVYEDYPDEETFIERFRKQGILSEDEIREAIDNTDLLIFFDDIDFDRSRKLPTIYPNLTQEERNQLYLDKVWDAWNQNKEKFLENAKWLYNKYTTTCGMSPDELNLPTAELYEDAIRYETEIVTSTNVSDYFLLDSEMIRLGVQKGGVITPTARGSASSFFTNTLLGLSTIDRLSLPVKLYPERFVTAERLKSSLPDIDLNMSDQKPFAEAQEELLGVGHSYPMIAYGTLKYKSAFKLYARAQGIPAEEANIISKQINDYEVALKEAEDDDERESIQIGDYVDSAYMKYVEGSVPYRGIVVSKSQAPCAFLIHNGDIRSEIGIMRINANGGKKVVYTTVLDGYTLEAFGYVKNDLLVVKVVDINSECMRRAHLPQYTSQDILRLTMDDVPTWNVFHRGWTQGINQCQGASTTENLKLYKPTQLRDLSAFVAAIRPGFKSMLSKFLQRAKFEYNVDSFDSILKNDSSGSSWLLYQEDIMHCLNLAGIEMSEAYKIIKAISKKKVSVINSAKEKFLIGFKDFILKSEDMSESDVDIACENVWRVILDASSYSFNASHAVCVSLDALYGAYLKAHYPMEYYSTLLDSYNEKGNKEKVTEIKQEMRNAFGIEIVSCRFRQDNRSFYMDKEKLQMADALSSVKYVSKTIANELYKMRNNQYDSFISLLCELDSNRAFNSRAIIILIKMGYFSEFGSSGKLFALFEEFINGKNKITKQLKDTTRNKRLAVLKEMEHSAEESEFSPIEQIVFETEYYGSPISVFPEEKGKYIVLDVETKYTPRATMYSIATGNIGKIKILKRDYNDNPFEVNDVITVKHHTRKQAYAYRDGERVPKKGVYEIWVNHYSIDYKHNEEE